MLRAAGREEQVRSQHARDLHLVHLPPGFLGPPLSRGPQTFHTWPSICFTRCVFPGAEPITAYLLSHYAVIAQTRLDRLRTKILHRPYPQRRPCFKSQYTTMSANLHAEWVGGRDKYLYFPPISHFLLLSLQHSLGLLSLRIQSLELCFGHSFTKNIHSLSFGKAHSLSITNRHIHCPSGIIKPHSASASTP